METLDKLVIEFIKKHHVLTLATAVDNQPYCANCFYAYIEKENKLVFTSDAHTKHIQDVKKNSYVGGSIVLETSIIGKIQGIQFNGIMEEPSGEQLEVANKVYLNRFPFARLMETKLCTIDLTFIKMTDNRLGFGKKIIWQKENK